MEILYGQELVNKLNLLAKSIENRLWIATPFLGGWPSVRRILSLKWYNTANIQTKLLLDIDNNNGIDFQSYSCFQKRASIKTLKGLHAKIYILDNSVILTSANLTNTAFTKRYEIGILLNKEQAENIIKIYEEWWDKKADKIPEYWKPIKRTRLSTNDNDEPNSHKLLHLFDLPPDHGEPSEKLASRFLDYEHFTDIYNNFANIYKNIQRIWTDSPLYLEIDGLLDYLFHWEGSPSNPYQKKKPRILTEQQRLDEIIIHAKRFKNWVKRGEGDRWRDKSSKLIRKLLRPENIDNIKKDDIREVVDHLNCMNSYPLNKAKFVNPKNNDIEDIRKAWKELLFGTEPIIKRMTGCNNRLNHFGKSSIQELIGFYYPDKYPIRNTNVNSGLRFFGYDVVVY